MNKQLIALATAALVLGSVSASVAADKMDGKMMDHKMMGHKMMDHKMMHGKMMHGKMVAYCAECKMYTTVAKAKKMHMMDPMGHKMMVVSMSKVPKGTKMMPSHGKMMDHKMMDHKMMDHKM